MLNGSTAYGAVIEKLTEFDRVAAMLEMPEAERLGILNVSREAYSELRHGKMAAFQVIRPELERRLSYALPLMRRLASNTRVHHVLPDAAKSGERTSAVSGR